MDIIILADFCGRFDKESNSRFLYLADILCKKHSVEVVTSDFNHGEKKYFKSESVGFLYKITMLHEGFYIKNVSLKRFRAHYIWGKNVVHYLNTRKKPDVIYCAVPTLKASYETAKYCEKNKIRFIVDIQDLWPEAFQMVFNVPILSQMIFAPFYYLANGIYRRADEICAVSQTYVDRALQVNKKCKCGHSVFLGTQLDVFDENARRNPILKKKKGELWIAYCGTLGYSYDIECVIEALALLRRQGTVPPRFLVMGNGPKAEKLKKLVKEKQVEAVFTGMLSYDKMCALLSRCDIAVNPIVDGSAASIINKHSDYAAAGLPVLNTQGSPEYKKLVIDYEMGFNCNNDIGDLAGKIAILLQDEGMRKRMGSNARRCAEEKFDRKNNYYRLAELIEK